MDQLKQRIKIAELDGYSDIKTRLDYVNLVKHPEGVYKDNPPEFRTEIPDYLNNLNMIRGLIFRLSEDKQVEWVDSLAEVLGWEDSSCWSYHKMILAPAEKWCEALLKMKGLWEDEK